MGVFDDLAFRLFGFATGAWFWLANSQTVDHRTGKRWDEKQGTHPWVLTAEYAAGPVARVRPRSTSVKRGISHQPHPSNCATNCRIKKPGWIPAVRWSIKASALTETDFSCNEPYEDIVRKLEAGDGE